MAYTYGSRGQIMDAQQAQGRNTNSIMAGWVDRGPWIYWDTITVASGTQLAQSYSPFSVPIGAQNPLTNTTKTKLLTNMVRGNQFPPPRCLLLLSIGFYFTPQVILADIAAILSACYMEFKIDDKIFHEGLLQFFPPGFGITGASTQNGESSWTNGLAAPCYSRRFDSWSKYIAPLQQFSMNIIFDGTPPTLSSTGNGLNMVITLDGLTDRSVQ